MDSQMPDGANLREAKLERGDLIVAINAGARRSMPAFDRLAYSDARCYGMKQADLKSRGLGLPTRRPLFRLARSSCSPTSCSRRSSAKAR